MTVVKLWGGGRTMNVTGTGYVPKGQVLEGNKVLDLRRDHIAQAHHAISALCNNAELVPPEENHNRRKLVEDG